MNDLNGILQKLIAIGGWAFRAKKMINLGFYEKALKALDKIEEISEKLINELKSNE